MEWEVIDPSEVPMTHGEALAAAARHAPPLPGEPTPRHKPEPGTTIVASATPRYVIARHAVKHLDTLAAGTRVEVNIIPAQMLELPDGRHDCVLVRGAIGAGAWVRADALLAA